MSLQPSGMFNFQLSLLLPPFLLFVIDRWHTISQVVKRSVCILLRYSWQLYQCVIKQSMIVEPYIHVFKLLLRVVLVHFEVFLQRAQTFGIHRHHQVFKLWLRQLFHGLVQQWTLALYLTKQLLTATVVLNALKLGSVVVGEKRRAFCVTVKLINAHVDHW